VRRLHRDGHVPKVRIAASRLTLQRPAFIESADPLNEGSRATPRASSITSDGGEANLPILAEQPGDDARAGTVSNQAQIALAYLRASRSFRSGPWFKPRFVDRGW